ncbi:MAG: Ig-like domain-containing protein [Gemmatimonadales bacterium]
MCRLKIRLAALLFVAGCARMGNPPGGPPDFRAPVLLATYPESTVVLPGFKDWVEFKFDETVSEGSQPNFGLGTGDLERLVLLSPSKPGEVPRVEWHRSRISVRPRNGWRPNTVYRIELAPGIRDLAQGRTNEVRTSHVITFATGGELPKRAIEGRAVDWAARRFIPNALVEAMLLPDSLVYRSVADSTGHFRLGPLPDGVLLVTVTADQNRNMVREGKEAWDTVRIAAGASRVGEVWAFLRDTVPPKVTGSASRSDSVNISITFQQPIDPLLVVPADSIRVLLLPDTTNKLTDSVSLGPISALPRAAHDSLYRARDEAARAAAAAAAAKPDSSKADSTTTPPAVVTKPVVTGVTKGAADTTAKDEPLDRRPPLGSELVVRTRGATRPGNTYLIEIRGVRSANGQVGTVTARLAVPKPPPPPKAKSATDSTKVKADSGITKPAPAKP